MPEEGYDVDNEVCQHFRESKDCEAACAYCKHLCGSHFAGDACDEEGCDCECFMDAVGEEVQD